eukprot:TRINITY_DN16094_c0_g1_i4.p1 TRINITY_DN16094_c0_g1~~TRINITY_DN16094_c0_g1_i4.p1  ORF type:complete len:349 (-),score=20.33 TRINITY_DN16094_c0_g1_i4:207-1253(-)
MHGVLPTASALRRGLISYASFLAILAQAELYRFDDALVPGPLSLDGVYYFYVRPTAGDSFDGAAKIVMNDLRIQPTADGDLSTLTKYEGVQLSILPHQPFLEQVNSTHFCCTAQDVQSGTCPAKERFMLPPGLAAYVHTLSTTASSGIAKEKQLSPGTYILVVTNCGNVEGATISGAIGLQSTYGYLPGYEYPKMSFYFLLICLHILLMTSWFTALCAKWDLTSDIQLLLSVVLVLSAAEAVLHYTKLDNWNTEGTVSRVLNYLAIGSTVLKCISTYSIMILLSLGLGMTTDSLDLCGKVKMLSMWYSYAAAASFRDYVTGAMDAFGLTPGFVLGSHLPAMGIIGLTL